MSKRRSELGDQSIRRLVDEAKKARRSARRRRTRAQYDLDPTVKQAIIDISTHESVPQSDLAEWALRMFIQAYTAGEIDLEPYLTFSSSLRYGHTIAAFPEHLNLPEKLKFTE